MAWPTPNYSRGEVNRAGDTLLAPVEDLKEWLDAWTVLSNWRSCHGYPINTFQATLRQKLQNIDNDAIVAQRLKRAVSIVGKLRRLNSMKLSRMQDIAGLRAVVNSLKSVRELHDNYRSSRFKHELVSERNYIQYPKESGYRSIHLVYRYKSATAPAYNGLLIELQIRSKLQHTWATAVETMGVFLDHALKSSEGPKKWLDFFSLAGAAFAHLERTPRVPGYEDLSAGDVFSLTTEQANDLRVREQLSAFTVLADAISQDKMRGKYHLIILRPSTRTVNIRSFPAEHLDIASEEYAKLERAIQQGDAAQAVLVSAGSVDNLKRAYPNFFLDTRSFITQLNRIAQMNS